jgi:hypothetical protein
MTKSKIEIIEANLLSLDGVSMSSDRNFGKFPNKIILDIGVLTPYWASNYNVFRNVGKGGVIPPYCIPDLHAKEFKGKKFKNLKLGLFFSKNDVLKYLEHSQKQEKANLVYFEGRAKHTIELANKKIATIQKKRDALDKRAELINNLTYEEKQIEGL